MRRTGQSASCKAQQKQRKGFTLTELLAGLSIATLLLALALPRWQGWLAEQRVETASSRLLSGLAQARAAAIRSGAPVRLCAASAEGSCSTQRQWGFGWLRACVQGQVQARRMPLNSPVAMRFCHSAGPVMCALVPPASTATVTGMSTTSNS